MAKIFLSSIKRSQTQSFFLQIRRLLLLLFPIILSAHSSQKLLRTYTETITNTQNGRGNNLGSRNDIEDKSNISEIAQWLLQQKPEKIFDEFGDIILPSISFKTNVVSNNDNISSRRSIITSSNKLIEKDDEKALKLQKRERSSFKHDQKSKEINNRSNIEDGQRHRAKTKTFSKEEEKWIDEERSSASSSSLIEEQQRSLIGGRRRRRSRRRRNRRRRGRRRRRLFNIFERVRKAAGRIVRRRAPIRRIVRRAKAVPFMGRAGGTRRRRNDGGLFAGGLKPRAAVAPRPTPRAVRIVKGPPPPQRTCKGFRYYKCPTGFFTAGPRTYQKAWENTLMKKRKGCNQPWCYRKQTKCATPLPSRTPTITRGVTRRRRLSRSWGITRRRRYRYGGYRGRRSRSGCNGKRSIPGGCLRPTGQMIGGHLTTATAEGCRIKCGQAPGCKEYFFWKGGKKCALAKGACGNHRGQAAHWTHYYCGSSSAFSLMEKNYINTNPFQQHSSSFDHKIRNHYKRKNNNIADDEYRKLHQKKFFGRNFTPKRGRGEELQFASIANKVNPFQQYSFRHEIENQRKKNLEDEIILNDFKMPKDNENFSPIGESREIRQFASIENNDSEDSWVGVLPIIHDEEKLFSDSKKFRRKRKKKFTSKLLKNKKNATAPNHLIRKKKKVQKKYSLKSSLSNKNFLNFIQRTKIDFVRGEKETKKSSKVSSKKSLKIKNIFGGNNKGKKEKHQSASFSLIQEQEAQDEEQEEQKDDMSWGRRRRRSRRRGLERVHKIAAAAAERVAKSKKEKEQNSSNNIFSS